MGGKEEEKNAENRKKEIIAHHAMKKIFFRTVNMNNVLR